MNCCDKECDYRELNGGDDISDFYFCKYCGIEVDRGCDECLIDKFDREIEEECHKLNCACIFCSVGCGNCKECLYDNEEILKCRLI